MEKEFWKKKKLSQLNKEEWEALCDHCGKCCLLKCNVCGRTVFTNFHCKHLNLVDCSCKDYAQRLQFENCIEVNLSMVATKAYLLPDTCAYKRLYQGKDLPKWHPLISGTYQSVIDSKNAVSCLGSISEEFSNKCAMMPLPIKE